QSNGRERYFRARGSGTEVTTTLSSRVKSSGLQWASMADCSMASRRMLRLVKSIAFSPPMQKRRPRPRREQEPPFAFSLLVFHGGQSLFQVLGDLVGAAGGLGPAGDALHPGDGVLRLHPLEQAGDAFQVAVAAAHYLDGLNGVVGRELDLGHAGAGALVGICKSHGIRPFCLLQPSVALLARRAGEGQYYF